ncbi:MAG: ABC transporter ATP-binding protein [Desulfopila sp.]|jgi:putative ABC transport system ATP-binding protein|nr:ABC transporter ATP-binding protein [Desulfopila sp.]
MAILETHEVTKIYTVGEREINILDGISLAVEEGEFVVISGSSGSGKTTLLSILSGLDKPTSGQIVLQGRDITPLDEDELAEIRNSATGFVFQAFHLIPSLNALENVMFPAELRGDDQAEVKARTLLERVGLWHRRLNFPSQLSGGEKQRVALCRALINTPAIIFADEPTGNLDSKNSEEIVKLLLEMQHEWNTTLIMATHSSSVTALAERVIKLHDGKLVT